MAKKPTTAEILKSLNVTSRPNERIGVEAAPFPPENNEVPGESVQNAGAVQHQGVHKAASFVKKLGICSVNIRLTNTQRRQIKLFALKKDSTITNVCLDALIKAGIIT